MVDPLSLPPPSKSPREVQDGTGEARVRAGALFRERGPSAASKVGPDSRTSESHAAHGHWSPQIPGAMVMCRTVARAPGRHDDSLGHLPSESRGIREDDIRLCEHFGGWPSALAVPPPLSYLAIRHLLPSIPAPLATAVPAIAAVHIHCRNPPRPA